MKMLNKQVLVLSWLLLIAFGSAAQLKHVTKFEQIIGEAVKKAYPASVRIWGFDVQQNQRTSGQFSGVVVTADGHILTAAHTILPGKNYKVFFPNGKECIAVALGRIDIARTPGMPDVGMMKIIDKGTWPHAEMGYSGSLQPNEPCISISYPESLNQHLPNLRLGHIAEVKNEYVFIRSTCKMEPGDSGGPLFDYLGRVIGLHSAIDVNEDQNFEIPVDLYRKYWTALQQEINYTDLPKVEDPFSEDALLHIVQKQNKLKSLHPDFKKAIKKTQQNHFSISSKVKGVDQQIQGTLFNVLLKQGDDAQYLVTKNSLLGVNPKLVQQPENKISVVARDQANDLVLLKVSRPLIGGVELANISSDSSSITMGKLIYTTRPNGELLNSVVSSNLFELDKISSQPYLGALVMYNSKPAQFSLIKSKGPASEAGIQVGDTLLSINGKAIEQASDFAPTMMKLWPDDEITLSWRGGSKIHTDTITLASQAPNAYNHPAEKFKGGKSGRRDGFSAVFAHDGALLPNECGTPIFDFQGRFLGINIARFSRTSTIGIPAYVVAKFIRTELSIEKASK